MEGLEMKEDASLLDLKAKLESFITMEPPSTSCCIYKVPPSLREVNEKDYTPRLVSIGPFHHRAQRLESMEPIKLWYLHKFLKRNPKKSFDDYAKYLQSSEDEIRQCYSETILMKSDKFVRMIMTDACFIIELFLNLFPAMSDDQTSSDDQLSSDDPLVSKVLWPISDIMLDLILIENQLPLFVLKDLFDQTFPTGFNGALSFLELTIRIFVDSFSENIYYTSNDKIFDRSSFAYQVKHLCDILRAFCLPSNLPSRIECQEPLKRSYSLSQLHEVGVKLQGHQGKRLADVLFSEGILIIPSIRVSNIFEILLRNVVAFEQCHYPNEHYMTDYIVLLDFLIQSGKDVDILVEKGIMESFLDSDTVASMFTNLRMNVIEIDANSTYASLHTELDTFYNNHYHKYKAIFMRDYWSTPWKKASCIAAVLLLFLTSIQTICSIIPLFKK